ncbi:MULTISPECIES: colicin immunity domain-containing protein [Amycolatopsis]|uniref:colicin immunity domain-containing protein n=1 Tax=Amycolatopsis TaxID=1813 RepID=UPI000689D21E|nr:colicin immunity domain-containing protein [Amycolatopsis nivea]
MLDPDPLLRPVETVLAGPRSFAAEWLAADEKSVVPVIAPSGADEAVLDRLRAGARSVGADEVLRCGLEPGAVSERLAVDSDLVPEKLPVLFVVPDLSGALLAGGEGYVLVAGTRAFIAGVALAGVDYARDSFEEEAQRWAGQYPGLPAVAAEYPPEVRAWARRSEVPADSFVARELAVMESFARGELSGPEFARSWSTAWRLANERRERVRTPFARVLHEVFYLLEDYPIDPALRDPGDTTDEELAAGVREALRQLAAADHPS